MCLDEEVAQYMNALEAKVKNTLDMVRTAKDLHKNHDTKTCLRMLMCAIQYCENFRYDFDLVYDFVEWEMM